MNEKPDKEFRVEKQSNMTVSQTPVHLLTVKMTQVESLLRCESI